MSISRRTLLGAGAAGLASSALGLAGADRPPKKGGKHPKNIIFCVVDGMAPQTMAMGNEYQQTALGHSSYWAKLMNEEYVTVGLEETQSLNSVVTDSAAGSSSWSSGRHIWNGMLNIYPDGTELRPIVSFMQEKGMRTGFVTTSAITDATPAGFIVSSISRNLEDDIALKYLKSGIDLFIGGGHNHFAADLRKDKRDVYADFAKAGYGVAKTRDEFLALTNKKILAIFSGDSMPYTVDRNNDPEIQKRIPTLAEMTSTALKALKGSPNGFLLQVEGGRIDHGGHANDLAAMIYDEIAFEEALKVIVDFALADKETLVIVTSDHATGGPGLNGDGDEYSDSTGGLRSLTGMKSSYGPVWDAIGNSPTVAKVREAVEAKLGIVLTTEEAQAVVDAKKDQSPFRVAKFMNNAGSTLAAVLGNHTKVAWTSRNHTSDHVLVTALGPGSEQCAGLTKNVKFFDIMLATKGMKWSNPTMSFEEAAKHYAKLRTQVAASDEYAMHGG